MTYRAGAELRLYLEVFSRYRLRPPRVTSTDRSQSQQDSLYRQGRTDVLRSKHVYGLAADLQPVWPGVTLQQLADHVRSWLPHVEAFPHGPSSGPDHVHIEWPWGY